MQKRKQLTTFRSVVRVLGGTLGVANLTKRTTQAVCNWRARGTFPSVLWFVISDELARLGFEAKPSLFGFEVRKPESNETNAKAA